jgi:hypothetical protein
MFFQAGQGFVETQHKRLRVSVSQSNRAEPGAATGVENKWAFPALYNSFHPSKSLKVVVRHRFAPGMSQMLENRFFEARVGFGLAACYRQGELIHKDEFALWLGQSSIPAYILTRGTP